MTQYILILAALLCCVESFGAIEVDTSSGICHIDGQQYCAIGYGTYPLRDKLCTQAAKQALDSGYSIIDTATFYGNFEAIAAAIGGGGEDDVNEL